jgi:hypothetical protein
MVLQRSRKKFDRLCGSLIAEALLCVGLGAASRWKSRMQQNTQLLFSKKNSNMQSQVYGQPASKVRSHCDASNRFTSCNYQQQNAPEMHIPAFVLLVPLHLISVNTVDASLSLAAEPDTQGAQ